MRHKLKQLLKKTQSLSKAQLAIFVLAFALIGYLVFRSFAASPLVASLEAEQMSLPVGGSVISDTSASSGKAIELSANGTAAGSVNFPSSVSSLTVMARGDQCSGAPTMSVAIDGTNYLTNTAISATSWTAYNATPGSILSLGTHNLSISFTNDYSNAGKTRGKSGKVTGACDRNLYVDVTNFYGPNTVTPPPTVTLSASPTSVTAGQASTLTWNSTNATGCTASGAWSGSEPTSGSASTGALNQTSTYTLSCTGDGGSASASATVTVTSGGTSLTISGAWYSLSSPWNTPIPAGVAIRSNNASLINAWQSQWCPNNQCLAPSDYYGTPSFWIANNSTPLVKVEVNNPSLGCGATHNNYVMVPIPSGTVVSHANDPEPVMAILQSDTGEEWDFYKVTAPGVATVNSSPALNCPTDSNWQAVIVSDHYPGWTSDGSGSSTRAAGTYSGAGTIRPRDTQAAAGSTWDHALAFVYAGALNTSVPPAVGSDGGCSDSNSCIPEGARIQLDPSINCSTWSSLVSAPEYVRQICRTLQKYGAIIIDTANPGGALVTENSVSAESTSPSADPPHNGVRYPWNVAGTTVHLPADLVSYLRVIDWTQWH